MKRIIFMVISCIFILCFGCVQVFANEKKISLSATASSLHSSYYSPSKALDGDNNTYWVGARYEAPWWIMFDAGKVCQINEINMKWFRSNYYIPSDYNIQISQDAVTWEDVYTGIAGGVYDGGDDRKVIDREARYIRLYINTLVAGDFPVLREFEAYTKISIPKLIRFQARLGDAQEIPLDGIFTLTFRLYDTETGGTAAWEEIQQNINVEGGILDVELGSVTPLEVSFDKQYWLGVEVESDGEMSPRFKLTSVPYAFISEE